VLIVFMANHSQGAGAQMPGGGTARRYAAWLYLDEAEVAALEDAGGMPAGRAVTSPLSPVAHTRTCLARVNTSSAQCSCQVTP
jgi:hypothetical protein